VLLLERHVLLVEVGARRLLGGAGRALELLVAGGGGRARLPEPEQVHRVPVDDPRPLVLPVPLLEAREHLEHLGVDLLPLELAQSALEHGAREEHVLRVVLGPARVPAGEEAGRERSERAKRAGRKS
jgi:hypothetical protein